MIETPIPPPRFSANVPRLLVFNGAALLLALATVCLGANGRTDLPPQTVQLPAGLDPLIREYPQPVDAVLKALKRAVDHYASKEFEEALKELSAVTPGGATQVGDYLHFYRAKSNLMLERFDIALELFRSFESRYPKSSLLQEAILDECQSLVKLNKTDAALAQLKNPKLEENADVFFLRGTALESAGKKNEAISLYFRVFAKYTGSKAAPMAGERLASLSPGFALKPANYGNMLERAENLVRSGRNAEARTLLLKLAPIRSAAAELGDRRKVLLAQAEYNLGRAATILPLLKGIPASRAALHSEALYWQAAIYRRLKREDSLMAQRDAALKLYPQSPFTEKILHTTATYFDVNNRPEECREAYASIAAKFPKGEYIERATWRMATLAYFLGQYDEALAGFWNFSRLYTNSKNAPGALFWMGRCYERLGDTARAAELYGRCRGLSGDNYHGQRASEADRRLKKIGRFPGTPYSGIDFAQVLQKADAIRPKEALIAAPSGAAALIAGRVHELATAGLPDLALAELRWGIRQFPDDRALKYLMSRLYEAREDYFSVISTLRRAFPDYDARPAGTLPRQVWELLFPAIHLKVITTQAAKTDVDPSLVLGLIRQESAFEPQAHSRANALGLMQVMPATGRMLAREAKIPKYSSRKLLQADVNITLGTRHLATLLQQYERRVEFALAAYNAGGDRVDRWRRDFGELDQAEFVERIPFGETRDYIKQVLTNAAYYRLLIVPTAGLSH